MPNTYFSKIYLKSQFSHTFYILLYIKVSNKWLMDLLRKNYKLAQPYAGAFLRKDERYDRKKFIYVHCVNT